MAGATVMVRRSARLLAAATLGSRSPEKVVPQKRIKLVPAVRVRSRNCETLSKDEISKKGDGLEKEAKSEDTSSSSALDASAAAIVAELPTELTIELRELRVKQVALRVRSTKAEKKLPNREMEMKLWELGFRHVAGVDEAGRGPLAGPVVAAACIIPASVMIPGVNDSKKLTEGKREELYSQIISTPGVIYAVHVIDAATIDQINILQATLQAMVGCVNKLTSKKTGESVPDYILVDGNRLPDGFSEKKAQCVVKGDAECHVIAAASILAKVTRDRMMLAYDKKWPEYGFKAHKGYGTSAHIAALLKNGPCDIHRRSFAPLKDETLITDNDVMG
ncbi:hypothetical protein CY35_15G085200 [Sphagnum magellanicum]|nr:hypothetical protein CY35_15G085200 [Sphagnum magellanicum]KAH9539996.1 hypothetical protein CY35_15G085200 [Sphagnum magellanicum]